MLHSGNHARLSAVALIAALLMIGLPPSGALTTIASAADFSPIFDGISLTGWRVDPPTAAGDWTVRNGVIRGEGHAGRSYLTYTKDESIADFELKLSYRFDGEGNSGVSVRATRDETGRRDFRSFHADLGHIGIGRHILGAWDFHTPGRTEHGCLRGEQLKVTRDDKAVRTALKDAITLPDIRRNGWNDVRIVADGNRYSFFINGKPSAEIIDELPSDRQLHRGMIQLQIHDPDMVVEFKELQLRVFQR